MPRKNALPRHLRQLIEKRMGMLTGAEFKIAVYLYAQLRPGIPRTMRIADLAQATGMSWRQTQSAVKTLAGKGCLNVASRRGRRTQFWLPKEFGRRAGPDAKPGAG